MQLTDAVLLVREQDPVMRVEYHSTLIHGIDLPRGPKNTEGPSTLSFDGLGSKSREGFTMSNDTWECSMTVGAR